MKKTTGETTETTDTKQSVTNRTPRGTFAPGNEPVAGFDVNPQNRHSGAWSKEKTVRGKLEKLLDGSSSLDEFLIQVDMLNMEDNKEVTLGDVLLSARVANCIQRDPNTGKISVSSKELDSLLYFVFGSKSENETTLHDDGAGTILKGFVIPAIDPNNIKDVVNDTNG